MKLPATLPLAALFLSSILANAAVSVTASGNLGASTDPVGNPLNGATFTVKTSFADQNYISYNSLPAAQATPTLTTITITGATDSSLNGTFSLYAGYGPSYTGYYYPTYAGLYGQAGDNNTLFFALGGNTLIGLNLFTAATTSGSSVTIGQPLALSHFSNSAILPSTVFDETKFVFVRDSNQSTFTITNGAFTATSIPEPTAAALLIIAAAGLLRRKR